MMTATKKLTRVGSYSKGIVIPREWLDATGANMYNLEYDERTHNITMIPVNPQRGTQRTYSHGQNAGNDYTPQPRQVYPPSPHPKFTPAKWANLHPSAKTIKLNDLEEMKQKGFEITAEGCDAYDQWVRQQIDSSIYTVRHARTFEDVPDATRNAYLTDVEPLLYFKDDTDKNHARTIWTNTYNMAIQLNSKEEYREAFGTSIRQLLTMFTYSADDDLDEL